MLIANILLFGGGGGVPIRGEDELLRFSLL